MDQESQELIQGSERHAAPNARVPVLPQVEAGAREPLKPSVAVAPKPSGSAVPTPHSSSSGGKSRAGVIAKQKEIEPWQILLQWILVLVPAPLGPYLIVGVVVLAGTTGLIGRAYPDFDLRLIMGSLWFLLALGIACAIWLVATIRARKKLGWPLLIGFTVSFLLGAALSGWSAWQKFQYKYNDLGFYEERHWHRAQAHGNAQPGNFEWRILGVKTAISTLSIQMPTDQKCQYSNFRPVEDPSNWGGGTVGWNACAYQGAGTNHWIVQNLGRGGSVIFTLDPANASILQGTCELPIVKTTAEHC
jgi:hypothetical protein